MSEAEADIRRVIDARAAAVHKGDVEAMMADVADHVVVFDVVDPLRRTGKASSRDRAAEWVALYQGPITWENRDVRVLAGGDVAFCCMLSRVTGTLKTDTKVDMWFRTTLGLERLGSRRSVGGRD